MRCRHFQRKTIFLYFLLSCFKIDKIQTDFFFLTYILYIRNYTLDERPTQTTSTRKNSDKNFFNLFYPNFQSIKPTFCSSILLVFQVVFIQFWTHSRRMVKEFLIIFKHCRRNHKRFLHFNTFVLCITIAGLCVEL